jgi:pimeloyl-ACP methyl ester carboxylesterase
MLAGTGVSGEQAGYAQGAAIQRARGMTNDAIESYRRMMRALIVLARKGATEGELLRQAREQFRTIPDAERIARLLTDPWHRAFVDYDPAPMLERVKCPVLVLNGDLDLQVVADVNVPAIEAAFRKGGNQRVTVRRFPMLNHLFQTAATGLPAEYQQIDETIAPVVLDTIANWLHEVGSWIAHSPEDR